jgi:hypothetical protein
VQVLLLQVLQQAAALARGHDAARQRQQEGRALHAAAAVAERCGRCGCCAIALLLLLLLLLLRLLRW